MNHAKEAPELLDFRIYHGLEIARPSQIRLDTDAFLFPAGCALLIFSGLAAPRFPRIFSRVVV